MSKSIEAVVELVNRYYDVVAPWPTIPTISEYHDPYIRVFSGLSGEGIGSLILTACLSNDRELYPSATVTLKHFMSFDGFVLGGGLRFLEDDQVKIVPGCCSGLENWHEWLDVPHGNNEVWAGHDPWPEIEYSENIVRIWQDKKSEGVSYIEFSRIEMEIHIEKVKLDLQEFLVQLKNWVTCISPGIEEEFVSYFANNMNIEQSL
jgi:hypothetical protein